MYLSTWIGLAPWLTHMDFWQRNVSLSEQACRSDFLSGGGPKAWNLNKWEEGVGGISDKKVGGQWGGGRPKAWKLDKWEEGRGGISGKKWGPGLPSPPSPMGLHNSYLAVRIPSQNVYMYMSKCIWGEFKLPTRFWQWSNKGILQKQFFLTIW